MVDVSNEGLRLELPHDRRLAPTPYFNVVVPMIGVGVTVQRMWARTTSGKAPAVTWCGGALSQNHAKAAVQHRNTAKAINVANPVPS